jgi:hypothetical protein
MNTEERITQLEARLAQAESRIAELERCKVLGPGTIYPQWTNPCPDLYRQPLQPDELRITCDAGPNIRRSDTP